MKNRIGFAAANQQQRPGRIARHVLDTCASLLTCIFRLRPETWIVIKVDTAALELVNENYKRSWSVAPDAAA